MAVTLGSAPAIGQFAAEVILSHVGWKWLFLSAALSAALVGLLEGLESSAARDTYRSSTKSDWIGIALLSVGFGLLQYALEEARKYTAWSETFSIGLWMPICGVTIFLAIVRAKRLRSVLDICSVLRPRVRGGCALQIAGSVASATSAYLVSVLIVGTQEQGSVSLAVYVLLSIGGSLVGAFTYSLCSRLIGTRLLILAYAVAIWLTSHVVDIDFGRWNGMQLLIVITLLGCFSVPLSIGSLVLAFDQADSIAGEDVSAMLATVRDIGLTFGTGFSAILATQYASMHYQDVSAQVTPYNHDVPQIFEF